jgi:hypothetical protein
MKSFIFMFTLTLGFNLAHSSEHFELEYLATFPNDDACTMMMALHPHSGRLHFLRSDGKLYRMSDTDNGPERIFDFGNVSGKEFAFHPQNGDIYVKDDNAGLRCMQYDEASGRILNIITITDDANVHALAVHPQTGELYFCKRNGISKVTKENGNLKVKEVFQTELDAPANTDGINYLTFHPDSGELYFVHLRHVIKKLKEVPDGPAIVTTITQAAIPLDLRFHPKSKELYFVTGDLLKIQKITTDRYGDIQIVDVVGSGIDPAEEYDAASDGPALLQDITIWDFQFHPQSGELWLSANHYPARVFAREDGQLHLESIAPPFRADLITIHPQSGNVYVLEGRELDNPGQDDGIGVIFPLKTFGVSPLKEIAAQTFYDALEAARRQGLSFIPSATQLLAGLATLPTYFTLASALLTHHIPEVTAAMTAASGESKVRKLREDAIKKREREQPNQVDPETLIFDEDDGRRVKARVDNDNNDLDVEDHG